MAGAGARYLFRRWRELDMAGVLCLARERSHPRLLKNQSSPPRHFPINKSTKTPSSSTSHFIAATSHSSPVRDREYSGNQYHHELHIGHFFVAGIVEVRCGNRNLYIGELGAGGCAAAVLRAAGDCLMLLTH